MSLRLVRRMPPAGYRGDCGCGGMGSHSHPDRDRPRHASAYKARRGGGAKLRRTKDGKLVSRRSKTGNPACSAAASLLALGKQTAESQQILGRCRAQARHMRDASIRRSAGDEVGAARADRRARRGLTDKETRERLAAARERRAAQVAGRGGPAAKPSRTESPKTPKPSRKPTPKATPRPAATTTTPAAMTRGAPSPALAAKHALSPEERITALYRKTQQRLAGHHDTPEAAARHQARLDAAAARFAALPPATQVAVATRLVGPAAGRSGASARRALETQFDRVNTSSGRARQISNFDRPGDREIHYGVIGSFPNTAPARQTAAARARISAAEDARRARQARAARRSEPPAATPKVAAAETRAMQLQATARSRMPDDIDRDVDRLIDSLTAAEARVLVHRVVGADVGKTKKAAKEALAKRIDDVRASHDRSEEILGFKSIGLDGDEDEGEDGPSSALKAARGRRRKGPSPADRTPPNVSRAARRVANGTATSADQKLLKQWEKARKAIGPRANDLDRSDLATLASESAKLSRLESRWTKRLKAFESKVTAARSKVESRLAGRVAGAKDPERTSRLADRARSDFDAQAADARPTATHRAAFMGREMAAAFSDADAIMGNPKAAARFVLRSVPRSVRDDSEVIGVLSRQVGHSLYSQAGGSYARNKGGFLLLDQPDDPAAFAGARSRADELIAAAMARRGTKAMGGGGGGDGDADPGPESGPAAGDG